MLCYHPALRVDQTPCTGWRHYLETFSLILVQCADHGSLWVPCTKGQWYRDIFSRVEYILPCSFCSHLSKGKPLSYNILSVIRFRVGYLHLSLILIKNKNKKQRKCHQEIEKNIPWHDNALTRISEFPAILFPTPDWWYNSTHWMGQLFLANVLMIYLDSFCLVIPLAGPSPKLGPHLFRIWVCSPGPEMN